MTSVREPPPRALAGEPAEGVTWKYDPWRERRGRAVAATACALGLCGVVVAQRLPFLLAAALCTISVLAFAPAIAPVECRLDTAGATRRGPHGVERRAWADVRRIEPLPSGVLLSPYARRHWLDAQRALALPTPACRRAELAATILQLWRGDGA